jgi:hypothetical protein
MRDKVPEDLLSLPENLTREQELYLMRLGVRFLVAKVGEMRVTSASPDGVVRKKREPHNKGKKWSATQRRRFLKTMRKKWKSKRAEQAAKES